MGWDDTSEIGQRPTDFWSLAQPEPITPQGLTDLDKALEIDRFNQKRIRPELVGQVHVLDSVR